MNTPAFSVSRALRALVRLVCAAWLAPAFAGQPAPAANASPAWRAGVATTVITPKTNLWLGGYAARTRPPDGTTQELYAKALAIADSGGSRFVFVTLDAIGVTRVLRKDVEARLAAAHRIGPHEFVLNASHTHSGPEFRPARVPVDGRGSVEAARAYEQEMAAQIERLVGTALERLAPAQLSYARARAGFAMNRRLPRPNADPTNAPNPDGPVDHDVPVLRVDAAGGKLIAILFGYACHNTTLTQAFYQFCGDYAGYAQQYLQEDHPGATALFLNGCGADQNPYPRGTVDHAQVHGRSLASAVEAALATKPRPLTGRIGTHFDEIQLPFAPVPSRAEYEQRAASKERYEAAHAKRMLERLEREGRLPTHYPYPVQLLQLGDSLKMVLLGAEVVVDYSLRLKQQYGGANSVWVSGYSNDIIGYIPNERVLREGGYEGATAVRIGIMPAPWAPGIEERIIGAIAEMDRALHHGKAVGR